MTPAEAKKRIILALDFEWGNEIRKQADGPGKRVGLVKIGLQAFSANGPDIVRDMRSRGCPVMLDLKVYDSPEEVAKTAAVHVSLGAAITTMHVSAGPEAMKAAIAARGDAKMRIVGITELTSKTYRDLVELGHIKDPGLLDPEHHSPRFMGPAKEVEEARRTEVLKQVVHLAKLAKAAGLDGVVCSPREAKAVREACGPDFLLIATGDGTLGDVFLAGADFVVAEGVVQDEELDAIAKDICNAAEVLMDGTEEEKAKTPGERAQAILVEGGCLVKNSHVLLKGGNCASEYIDHRPLVNKNANTELLLELAKILAREVDGIVGRGDIRPVTVVGLETCGEHFARWLAWYYNRFGDGRPWMTAVRAAKEGKDGFRLEHSRPDGAPVSLVGQRCLVIDDVLTTGTSVRAVLPLIEKAGSVCETLVVSCDRSGKTSEEMGVPPVRSLFTFKGETWKQTDCPQCQAGVPWNLEIGHAKKFLEEQRKKLSA